MIVGVTVPAGRADAAREAVSRWQAERHERMKADEGRLLTRLKLWLLVSTAAVGGGLALGLRWEAAASVSAVLLVMVFVYPDSHAATPAAACPPAEDEEDESEDDPADAYWMEGAGEGDSP